LYFAKSKSLRVMLSYSSYIQITIFCFGLAYKSIYQLKTQRCLHDGN
jgi:hypothetical protein